MSLSPGRSAAKPVTFTCFALNEVPKKSSALAYTFTVSNSIVPNWFDDLFARESSVSREDNYGGELRW